MSEQKLKSLIQQKTDKGDEIDAVEEAALKKRKDVEGEAEAEFDSQIGAAQKKADDVAAALNEAESKAAEWKDKMAQLKGENKEATKALSDVKKQKESAISAKLKDIENEKKNKIKAIKTEIKDLEKQIKAEEKAIALANQTE